MGGVDYLTPVSLCVGDACRQDIPLWDSNINSVDSSWHTRKLVYGSKRGMEDLSTGRREEANYVWYSYYALHMTDQRGENGPVSSDQKASSTTYFWTEHKVPDIALLREIHIYCNTI